jgi:hypothetical protein
MSDESIWEQEVKEDKGTGEWETCPPGNYPASVVAIFDIGTQTEVDDKQEKYEVRQLVLVVETQRKTAKGEHFFFSKKYTWSLHESSNWYKLICAVTGTKFQPGQKFDPRKLLGWPCMANITNTDVEKKGKKNTFANLETIAQFPEGFPIPKDYRPPVAWSVNEGKALPNVAWVPNIYGKSVTTLVERSKEYAQGKLPVNMAVAASTASLIDNPQTAVSMVAAQDDIPF